MHKRILKFAVIFVLIFGWIFGYPPVYENFWRARISNFPPSVPHAYAETTKLAIILGSKAVALQRGASFFAANSGGKEKGDIHNTRR